MDEQIKKIYEEDPEFRFSRLVSLFGDYNYLKESNNEGYTANLTAWKRIVSKVIETKKLFIIEYIPLQKKLTYVTSTGEYVPQGLYIVLEELVKEGKLAYVTPQGVVGYLRWLIRGNVKTDKLVSKITVDKLKLEVKGEVNELHLKYLLKDLGVNEDLDVGVEQRFFNVNENPKTNVKFAIYRLEKYVSDKDLEITKYKNRVRVSVKEKRLDTARSELKICKIIESQKNNGLLKLEQLYLLKSKMEESENNELVMDSFEMGKEVLRSMNDKVHDVEDLVENLNDEVRKVNDISDLLGKGVEMSEGDDEDLDQELKLIEEEETGVDDVVKQLESLKVKDSEIPTASKEQEVVDTSLKERVAMLN